MPTKGKIPFLAGLFLICMCVLMLQIIETRVLSVVAYYYLAFFAIGMAMFGMTAGSLFSLLSRESLSQAQIVRKISLDLLGLRNIGRRLGIACDHDGPNWLRAKN